MPMPPGRRHQGLPPDAPDPVPPGGPEGGPEGGTEDPDPPLGTWPLPGAPPTGAPDSGPEGGPDGPWAPPDGGPEGGWDGRRPESLDGGGDGGCDDTSVGGYCEACVGGCDGGSFPSSREGGGGAALKTCLTCFDRAGLRRPAKIADATMGSRTMIAGSDLYEPQ